MYVFDIYKNQIAYYKTPKCATRTILGWAAIIKDPNILEDHPEWFDESRRKIEYRDIRLRIEKYESLSHDQKIRFCVVRDPVERFISAFTNRILFHKKPNVDISITEFIDNMDELLEQKLYADAKLHFTTQTKYIGEDPSLYTHIFDISELENLKSLLESHTGIVLPDLHLQKSGSVQKPCLTEQQIKHIKKRYSEDYEIYGKWMK
jgi:hypothetical protein